MFARVIIDQVQDGKMDGLTKAWKEGDIPLMESVKGYRGAYLFTDRKTGKINSITLWDSEQDAIANSQSPVRQKQHGALKDYLVGPPIIQGFEVSATHMIK